MLPLLDTATVTIDGLDKLGDVANSSNFLSDLTGLVAVILSLGMPIIIVLLVLMFRHARIRRQHEVVMKLAEKVSRFLPNCSSTRSARKS